MTEPVDPDAIPGPTLTPPFLKIPPTQKLIGGALLFSIGATFAPRMLESGSRIATPIAALVIGVIAFVVGLRETAMRHRIEIEVATAIDRRSELTRRLTELEVQGSNVPRFLSSLGFRSVIVRRWIQQQFGSGKDSRKLVGSPRDHG